jgi:hypothetical protein
VAKGSSYGLGTGVDDDPMNRPGSRVQRATGSLQTVCGQTAAADPRVAGERRHEPASDRARTGTARGQNTKGRRMVSRASWQRPEAARRENAMTSPWAVSEGQLPELLRLAATSLNRPSPTCCLVAPSYSGCHPNRPGYWASTLSSFFGRVAPETTARICMQAHRDFRMTGLSIRSGLPAILPRPVRSG